MRYEWNPSKARASLVEHGVSFAEAVTVFEDGFALTRKAPDSGDEQRFVTLGMEWCRQPAGRGPYLPRTRYHPHHLGLERQPTAKVTL